MQPVPEKTPTPVLSDASARSPKRVLFLVTLLQACPTTFFLYGEPFYAREKYGWNIGQIGLSQALIGLCVAVGAYTGGQIAHRSHPDRALRAGWIGMIIACLFGLFTQSLGSPSLMLAIAVFAFSQAMIWPGIETALMDGEPHDRVQNFVGYFNLTWSLGTSTVFLCSTPLLNTFGLNIIFVLPLVFAVCNLLLLASGALRERPVAESGRHAVPLSPSASPSDEPHLDPLQRVAYRWLGWLSNPLSFIAINVVVTYNPTVQARLGIDFVQASIWCSLWFYMRTAAFEILRRWTWWRYKWGFLCFAFLVTMISFVGIALAPTLPVLLISQAAFGLCTGLLYQSSLLYSMAGSDAQGEHGGLHECFIGVGCMLGPLIVYGAARLAPGNTTLPILCVLTIMGLGLIVLLGIGLRERAGGRG